jgi:hypothetical protein
VICLYKGHLEVWEMLSKVVNLCFMETQGSPMKSQCRDGWGAGKAPPYFNASSTLLQSWYFFLRCFIFIVVIHVGFHDVADMQVENHYSILCDLENAITFSLWLFIPFTCRSNLLAWKFSKILFIFRRLLWLLPLAKEVLINFVKTQYITTSVINLVQCPHLSEFSTG